jgi:hypothetical protein
MLSFKVAPEIEEKVSRIAEETGTSVENLLNDMTTRMVEDFDAFRIFQEMAVRVAAKWTRRLSCCRSRMPRPDFHL